MRKQYNEQLNMLHQEMISMGSLCEEAITLAIKALTDNEEQYISKVFEVDSTIDKKERDIESLCLRLLLQQQPVASDLRDISSALKMISDMERIGDHATNIAEWVEYSITGKRSKDGKII